MQKRGLVRCLLAMALVLFIGAPAWSAQWKINFTQTFFTGQMPSVFAVPMDMTCVATPPGTVYKFDSGMENWTEYSFVGGTIVPTGAYVYIPSAGQEPSQFQLNAPQMDSPVFSPYVAYPTSRSGLINLSLGCLVGSLPAEVPGQTYWYGMILYGASISLDALVAKNTDVGLGRVVAVIIQGDQDFGLLTKVMPVEWAIGNGTLLNGGQMYALIFEQ